MAEFHKLDIQQDKCAQNNSIKRKERIFFFCVKLCYQVIITSSTNVNLINN